MNSRTLLVGGVVVGIGLLAVLTAQSRSRADDPTRSAAVKPVDKEAVVAVITKWAAGPRLGAAEMVAKYGMPQEATAEHLIWRNPGPFKRITVFNLETPHDFPLPHIDYMEHTITYDVPQDKVGDLIAFDASSTINRTAGELSARCDLEGHNVLTLNLDHDIVTGKKTVEQARKAFGDIVVEDVTGKHPAYVENLQFAPHKADAAQFPDKPVIPGSPVRATKAHLARGDKMGDAEVLAAAIVLDHNEILAASEAEHRKIGQPVLAFAKMLHEEHGADMVKAMKLGQLMGVAPVNGSTAEKLDKQGAGELAAFAALDGPEFERAYVASLVKGHADALDTIDNVLLKAAANDDLKKHLTAMRTAVAAHLEKAKGLAAGPKR